MKAYEILFIAGFVLLILGMIPIFYGFVKTIFEMITDIKNHDYDMLPELLLSLGVIAMLVAVILNVAER